MAEKNGTVIMLDPRRNQTIERKKLFEEMLLKEMPGTSRTNEPMHAVLEGELGENEMVEGREAQNVRNHALIHYLATLANSNSTKDTFDFDFVESLLRNGADINSTDKTGQTVFHEVARSWNSDVAKFLIENGADVNHQDQYGRSPLHVAAAVDYAEMVEFLLQNGADIDIKTTGEEQTPIHFAAKNDAINSLQMLLGYGANIDARDGKNRTPLQLSAEMNRSKAAKLLIAEGAPAGVYDNLGNSALSLLIEKIPEVALDAMDQFHSVDTINRKEFYFLNYLEGTKLKEEKTPARTPLEIAVQNERFDIIMHPIMERLIAVKWKMYGKLGAVFDLILNLLYTILWTVLAVTLPNNGRDLYLPLAKNSWRLIIGVLLILFTIWEIRKQIVNTIKTRRELKKWREWRAAELERDLAYCHPRWPQEAQYLKAEIKAVRNLSLISGSDWWIYFDWVALVLILATIASHVTFFHYSNDVSKEVHHYIIIPLLLILWLRIFKYARPFEGAGPFVVIFGSVMGDIVKWGFLNSIIVIPFTCAFWITFGAISLTPVEGYNNVGPLFYNIFSMMVVNDHGYENLEKANPVMARLLCGSFIGIAAIVTLNLLIALLSNTFERLYENAVANAVMQRARTILLLQKSLRKKQKKKYYEFIKTNGSPEVIVKTLGRLLTMDGDDHATIERVRDDVKVIVGILGEKFGRKFGKGKKSDLDFVKMDVSKVRRFQEELIVDVKNMRQTLQDIMSKLEEMKKNHTENSNSNDNNNNNNVVTATLPVVSPSISLSHENHNKALKKIVEKSSEDESETETSETDSESESSSSHKRHEKWTKSRKERRQSNRRSSNLKDLHDTPKKHKKDSKKDKPKQPHFARDEKQDISNKPPKTHQQLAYPPIAGSRIPDIYLQNAAGYPFGQRSYPANYYPGVQNNDSQNQRNAPNTTTIANGQAHGNNQWFPTTPIRSEHPQRRYFMENPGLQDFGQQSKHDQFPARNFNQPSTSPYDMRQQGKWYFDQHFPNSPSHRAPVQNIQSLQSSPYSRHPLETDHSRQPQSMQNAERVYGYQNYGFRALDQDENQMIPSGYASKQLPPNNSFLTQNRDFKTRSVTRPIAPSVSQYTSVPLEITSIELQKHGVPRNAARNAAETVNSSALQGHPSNTTSDKLVPDVQVQSVADRNQESRFLASVHQGETYMAAKLTTLEDTRKAPKSIDMKPPELQEREIHEKSSMSLNEDREDPASILETQMIPRIDVSPAKSLEVSAFVPSNSTNEPKSRPSTPVCPEIQKKVVFFEERINQSESSKNGEQNEIKMSRDVKEVQQGIPLAEIGEQSSSSPGLRNDAAPLLLHDVGQFQLDNTTVILNIPAEYDQKSNASALVRPSTDSRSSNSGDDVQNKDKYQTDEGRLTENVPVHSQPIADDSQEIEAQTRHSPVELQSTDANETPEEAPHADDPDHPGGLLLESQITVAGMNKAGSVQDIGWV